MVIDASVFVSAVVGHEASHQQSIAFLSAILRRRLTAHGPTLLPVEVASAVARNTRNPDRGRETYHAVESSAFLKLHPIDSVLARKAGQLAVTHFLRGADAVYVALAAKLGVSLITLDGEMLERTGSVAYALTPQAWLRENPG